MTKSKGEDIARNRKPYVFNKMFTFGYNSRTLIPSTLLEMFLMALGRKIFLEEQEGGEDSTALNVEPFCPSLFHLFPLYFVPVSHFGSPPLANSMRRPKYLKNTVQISYVYMIDHGCSGVWKVWL